MGLALTLLLMTSVDVTPPACRPAWFDPASFEAMLETETATTATVRVTLSVPDCDQRPNDVEVSVRRGADPSRNAIYELGDVTSDARLRTLVLAVAELLTTPPPKPKPKPEPEPEPEPRGEAARPSPSSRQTWQLGVTVATRFMFTHDQLLLGATATARHRPVGMPIFFALHLGVETGRRETELGRVAVDALSAAAEARFLLVDYPTLISAGPRLELGWAFSSGVAADGQVLPASGSGGFAVFEVAVGTMVAATDDLALTFDLSGGFVLRAFEATADATPVAGYAGPVLAARVGGAWSF